MAILEYNGQRIGRIDSIRALSDGVELEMSDLFQWPWLPGVTGIYAFRYTDLPAAQADTKSRGFRAMEASVTARTDLPAGGRVVTHLRRILCLGRC